MCLLAKLKSEKYKRKYKTRLSKKRKKKFKKKPLFSDTTARQYTFNGNQNIL